jgi:hypothetical protein
MMYNLNVIWDSEGGIIKDEEQTASFKDPVRTAQ